MQAILACVAMATGIAAYEIADNGYYRESASTGLDGGALGMSIVCAVCIICAVWLEIFQQKEFNSGPQS